MCPQLSHAGLFHSIYGTEGFQGFSLSFSHRPAIAALIGERSETLAFTFCVIDRYSVDLSLSSPTRTLYSRPELGRFPITLTEDLWYDFLELTLADWLEQVESAATRENALFRWKVGEAYAYRRDAYKLMATILKERSERLQVAFEMLEKVMETEGVGTRELVQPRTPPMSEAAEKVYEVRRVVEGGEEVPETWAPVRRT